MAVHRPLVLQTAHRGDNPLQVTLSFKDGVRINASKTMEPITRGRVGLYRPEEWEHRILGQGNDSGVAVVQWIYAPS